MAKVALVKGSSVYMLQNYGTDKPVFYYLHGRFVDYGEAGYLKVEFWNEWWQRWEERTVHRRQLRLTAPPKLYQEIRQGPWKHTFLEPKHWPEGSGPSEKPGTPPLLELQLRGELLVFHQLIDAVRQTLQGVRSDKPLIVRLADEPENDNAIYFSHGNYSVRVKAIVTGKDKYLLRQRFRNDFGYREIDTLFEKGEDLRAMAMRIHDNLFQHSTG